MNYYLDTEFLEGTQDKRILGFKTGAKTKPTIDLISIGIVSEDDREYYAISKDFNLKEAWNRYNLKRKKNYQKGSLYLKEYWIRENVLKPIFDELYLEYLKEIKYYRNQIEVDDYFVNIENVFTYRNFKELINKYGKSNAEIVKEIKEFTDFWNDLSSLKINTTKQPIITNFYTYYGDYDWVVFCWLFGKMIDLPKGFPMYARDLKQVYDKKQSKVSVFSEFVVDNSVYKNISELKQLPIYPKQENEHNALADARWNKKLHEFLKEI